MNKNSVYPVYIPGNIIIDRLKKYQNCFILLKMSCKKKIVRSADCTSASVQSIGRSAISSQNLTDESPMVQVLDCMVYLPINCWNFYANGKSNIQTLPGSSPAVSPTASLQAPTTPDQSPPAPPVAEFHTEDEVVRDKPTTPSKEELETNEKNLAIGKLGQLVFKIRYNREKSALVVSVVRCRNLPARDANLGSSDPYVKLQLLPDKLHKVKTRVLRKTRDPVYDEDFTFYRVTYNELQSITLHFVVLSFDRYSRDDIIGEVLCSLNTVDLSLAENQQLTLCRDIHPRSLKIRAQGRGEILVSLCWQPAANRLTVVVLKARNLPKMDVTGLTDPYVKMYLLYNNQRIAKKKTHVKKRTLNPVFNESFVFDIPAGAEGLDNVSLEFLLLDWDRVTKNEVIGRLELGAAKSTGSALHHWNEVCNSPRRQIAEWHKLRE